VENIRYSDIVMRNVGIGFSIDMFYHHLPEEPVSERTPTFRNIYVNDLSGTGVRDMGRLRGLPEMPIQGVIFNNVRVSAKNGLNVSNVKDIELHNVQFDVEEGPALRLKDIENLELDGFRTRKPHEDTPVVEGENVNGAFIRACSAFPGTAIFLRLTGEATNGIFLSGNNLRGAERAIDLGEDVSKGAVLGEDIAP
jgi:hypothetical protein